MKVDTDTAVHVSDHSRHGSFDFGRQRTTVGVTQHHRFNPRNSSLFEHSKAELRVSFVAVKEVFSIEKHPFTSSYQEGHGVGDHCHALIKRRTKRLGDVIVPTLADDAHDLGPGGHQIGQRVVRINLSTWASGRAESHKLAGRQMQFGFGTLEELVVFGVSTRVTALDISDTEQVKLFRDPQFVVNSERYSF